MADSLFQVLASSLVYNLSDGQFASRADLIDAAGSSLGRGALVPGLGKTRVPVLEAGCYRNEMF